MLSGEKATVSTGNTLKLKDIPVGTVLHCIELKPLKGAQLARSAGTYVQFIAKEGQYASLRLKSGEVRKVLIDCKATIGEVSNQEHSLRSFGKAGAKRWLGIRPTVRGVAMNPIDHPTEVEKVKHLEEDIQFLHGEFPLKVIEQEIIKELIH